MNGTIEYNGITYAASNIIIVYETLNTGDTVTSQNSWTATVEDLKEFCTEFEFEVKSDPPFFRYIRPEYDEPRQPRSITVNNHFIRWIARRLGRQ